MTIDFNCQSIVNPLVDTVQVPARRAGDQYGKFKDEELIKLYDAMNRTGDVAEQKRLMRAYEKRVLDEQAHNLITLWWYRIIAHRTYMKGWKITPSHYLNQDLSVRLDRQVAARRPAGRACSACRLARRRCARPSREAISAHA